MIEALITYYTNGNKAQFAKYIGVSPQTISAWLSRNTFDNELLYTHCVDVSAEWLLAGEGPMLKTSPSGSENTPAITPKPPKSTKVPQKGETTTFLSYIREKDAIIEQKNAEITNLRCDITRLELENSHLREQLSSLQAPNSTHRTA